MRVVTIKRPPSVVDDPPDDNLQVGDIREISPNVALLLIAAGWARSESRREPRRDAAHSDAISEERRHLADRRSTST